MEQVNNDGATQIGNICFKNKYLKWFPSASISDYKTEDEFLKLSYSKRINRPELDQLNPFMDITDALSPHSGNPYLKPEIIDVAELGYNKEWSEFSLVTTCFLVTQLTPFNDFRNCNPMEPT